MGATVSNSKQTTATHEYISDIWGIIKRPNIDAEAEAARALQYRAKARQIRENYPEYGW